jgi:prepilin-type N-terminal cleavage/methylation domain-containing protein
MKHSHLQQGLTLVEVLISFTIVGILLAVLSTSVTSNLGHTRVAGQKTEAVQILNFMGRMASSGDSSATGNLPTSTSTPKVWNYNSLGTDFPELSSGSTATIANPALYKVTIELGGTVALATSAAVSLRQYDITVCFKQSKEECIVTTTFGPNGTINFETPD